VHTFASKVNAISLFSRPQGLKAEITDGIHNLLPIPVLLDPLTQHAEFHRICLSSQRPLQKNVEADEICSAHAMASESGFDL
jgi:hypothetical protein